MTLKIKSEGHNGMEFFRLKPLPVYIKIALAGGMCLSTITPGYADSPLPIPAQLWTSYGKAEQQILGNTLKITQETDRAILNWKEFDVAEKHKVEFHQPGVSSIALNRISDIDGSKILGTISANGQVYLYNPNGILFGKNSTVDVHTLVASSLNISDDVFKGSGIVNAYKQNGNIPALNGVADPNSKIEVQQGAKLHVGESGRLILAAPNVVNSGNLSADKFGQILLVASKDKIYLSPKDTSDPFFGLLVEVGTGGKVTNQGDILARQGNITLAGFLVNQNGHATATTSTNVNGSIRLIAREQSDNTNPLVLDDTHIRTTRPSDLGDGYGKQATVTFGKGSTTQVVADKDAGKGIDELKQPKSYLEAYGNTIHMESGSSVVVPGGNVVVDAEDIRGQDITGFKSTAKIQVDTGATIDVSGAKNITESVTRNVVEVPVQSYELRNSPQQKGGILKGFTVFVDIRDKNSILDIGGGLARIERGVDERLAMLGLPASINLKTDGNLVVNPNAKVDISGGIVNYTPGIINTTQLLTDYGAIVDIGEADPNQHYQAVFGAYKEVHEKWGVTKVWQDNISLGHFEQGYQEGLNAGVLNIAVGNNSLISWNGILEAGSVSGLYQRSQDGTASKHEQIPAGGELNIASLSNNFFSQNIVFDKNGNGLNIGIDEDFPKEKDNEELALVLSTKMINRSGLEKINIKTTGSADIHANANINMESGSTFEVSADSGIDVAGRFNSAGGTINLESGTKTQAGHLTLASTALFNVSGRWVNDFAQGLDATPTEALAINGGKVSLAATGDLDIQSGATIKADGGAWYSKDESLKAGEAGTIDLAAVGTNITGSSKEPSLLHLNGNLSAYGVDGGGTLSLTSGKIIAANSGTVVVDADQALVLGVKDGLLDIKGIEGFGKINLTSAVDDLIVKEQTTLNLIQQNRVMDADFQEQASSRSIASFSHLETLPETQRKPVDLSLTADGNVVLEAGTKILGDNKATINLTSTGVLGKGIFVDGMISASAGTINLSINTEGGDNFPSTQAIWLGKNAQLLAKGSALLNPVDALGRQSGEVLDGGSVALDANRGYVVLEQGSAIDVSGTHSTLDLPTGDQSNLIFAPANVGSSGGKIALTAAQGLILDGSLSGKAGSASNSGGQLKVSLDSTRQNPENPITLQTPINLNIRQVQQPLLDGSTVFGDDLKQVVLNDGTGLTGNATLSAAQIINGGFDDVRLSAVNTAPTAGNIEHTSVNFLGDVSLSVRERFDIDAPTINWKDLDGTGTGSVNINTAYLRVGTTFHKSNNIQKTVEAPNLGGGQFTADTQWTQFEGASRWDNFNAININSAHDIRAVGISPTNFKTDQVQGKFVTAANVNFKASQLYPSTYSKYTFAIENNPNGVFTVAKSGNNDSTPLSAAGELTINAPLINQNGTIKAPFGSINLNAGKALALGPGSLTSVSGSGLLVPFGNTFAGQDWLYPYIGSQNSKNPFFVAITSPPDKKLRLSAPSIDMKDGSTVDLSGGGDLLAYEFQPGIGGSADYLNTEGKFAIVPGLGSSIAPNDPLQSFGFDGPVGQQVYLSGNDQLKAGFYTLLPAHYALLPGAFLVTPQSGTQDQRVTTVDLAGLSTVAGYKTVAGTGTRDARWSGFLLEDGKEVRKHSQYEELKANDFFTQRALRTETPTPILPRDAGQLVINNVDTKLTLRGDLKTDAPGGKGARVDLAAKNLKIVNSLSATPIAGSLEVLAGDLNGLHADSLLLGGERSRNLETGATQIDVTSDEVVFENQANLQGTDLIAAAKNQVTVKAGATLAASGTVNTGDTRFDIQGDGALLRVSADKQVALNRTAEDGSTLGAKGVLKVEAGATLAASSAMLLDATNASDIAGTIKMTGGSLNLGANGINIGEVNGKSGNISSGLLNLSNSQFANLNVDELILTSRDTINLYGNVGQQGTDGKFKPLEFKRLVLNSGGFAGFGKTDDFTGLQADNLVLQNINNVTPQTVGTGKSQLNIGAENYSQGAGVFSISGFDATNITVDKGLTAAGNGKLNIASNLHMTTGYMASSASGSLVIDASGFNAVLDNKTKLDDGTIATLFSTAGLGGTMEVTANSLNFDTVALLPSGKLMLKSLTGNVSVGSSALIKLEGREVPFADTFAYTPGGVFHAVADQGNIVLAQGSRINLVAGGGSAASGVLDLEATKGHVELLGGITATDGSARIDVADFNDSVSATKDSQKIGFDTLANALMDAKISKEIYIRSRTADIVKHSANEKDENNKVITDSFGNTIQAIKADKITLVSDQGDVRISGALNTDKAGSGGSIKLLADDNIILKSGAMLSAKGTTNGAEGGKVLLAATDVDNKDGGGIDVRAGSTIDVSGGAGGKGGEVVLRALRVDSNGDGKDDSVNIKPIAGTVNGFSGFYADGVKKYDNQAIDGQNAVDGQIDAKVIATIKGDTEAFMATGNIVAVSNALGKGIKLRPGIEIDYKGDLKLTEAWDFITWGNTVKYQFPGSTLFPIGVEDQRTYLPGVLNINVSGDFRLEKAISDGFTFNQFPFDQKQKDSLQTNDSWSYQLAAGADLASADKSAVVGQSASGLAKSMIVAENPNEVLFDFNNGMNIHSTVIRTGTGDIELSSAGDIVFESTIAGKGVSVYVAGKADKANPYGTNGPQEINSGTNKIVGDFPIQGGNLEIHAGNNIKGALNQDPYNSSGWLLRKGSGLDPEGLLTATSWGIVFGSFKQNIGSFGGGKVDISAGGNISDLAVAMPTTGKQMGELNVPGDPSLGVKTNQLQISGGGQLQVNAGGDIAGGVFYLGQGKGVINAAGAVTGSTSIDPDPENTDNTVADLRKGPQLLMGAADLTVNANKGLDISAVSDPMVVDSNGDSHFFSYGQNSKLHFSSLSGDVRLGTDTSVIGNSGSNDGNGAIKIYPGSLDVASFTGNILLDGTSSPIILFPSPKGDLNLFASENISRVVDDSVVQGFAMSDLNAALLPSAVNPVGISTIAGTTQDQNILGLLQTFQNIPQSHALTPIHRNDSTPVRIVTQNGDIKGLTLNLPKKAIIQSGRDLLNNSIDIQHTNNNDASIISAKRDIRYPIQRDPENGTLVIANIGMRVAGPGDVLLKSGRNIDFGLSNGLTTIGNEFNPNLGQSGAGLVVLTGLNGAEPNYLGFEGLNSDVLKYADNFNKVQQLILDFMKQRTGNTLLTAKKANEDFKKLEPSQTVSLAPQLQKLESPRYTDLIAKMKAVMVGFIWQRSQADAQLTEGQALDAFKAIKNPDEYLAIQPKLNQLANRILFSELKQTASASAKDKTLGNVRGFDAIKALYTDKHQWNGSLNLFFSQLQTKRGGGIDLLAPGGEINVGLPVGNAGINKPADTLGISVQGTGSFNALLRDDFSVNQSRVFTLGGGDVLVWSSLGDIDAGRGAKSSLAAPNPVFTVDQNGDMVITTPPPVFGSGIRTSAPAQGGKAGDVTLSAPGGVVNASEAGIAGNNVTISATAVLGAGNIAIGGVGTGVPTTSNVSVAAGLTGVSNLTANVSQVAQAAADLGKETKDNVSKSHQLGSIKVELLGFGDGSASNNTDEQKHKGT